MWRVHECITEEDERSTLRRRSKCRSGSGGAVVLSVYVIKDVVSAVRNSLRHRLLSRARPESKTYFGLGVHSIRFSIKEKETVLVKSN